jgi:hypothetical protein
MGRMLRLLGTVMMVAVLPQAAEPSRGFAAVVHPSNPARDLPLRDVTSLFEGRTRQWPNRSKVVLVERDALSAPYRFLMAHLLNTTAGDYKRRLQSIEYGGDAPVSIKILNSDQAACQFVFNVPSAIAIVENNSLASAPCRGVQVLKIDGKLPDQEGYRMK